MTYLEMLDIYHHQVINMLKIIMSKSDNIAYSHTLAI